MNYGVSVLRIVLGVFLVGCSYSTPATSPTEIPTFQVNVPVLGQTLPISAQANIAGSTIELEVARTQQQQAMGLMHRTTLADDRGMLFLFEPPQRVSFWMKNVPIPLDMIFLRDGKVKAIAASVPPCTTEPCSTYESGTSVNQVIELRGGLAAELSLKVGDQVKIKFVDS